MVTCEICGRQFKNTQGLRGHKTFKHGVYASSNTPVGKTDNVHPLSKLENRVDKLENFTGISSTSLPGVTAGDKPSLCEKFSDINKQVSNLTQQLIGVSKATASNTEITRVINEVGELTRQISNLSRSVQPVKNVPSDLLHLENELDKRASNARVGNLERKISQLETNSVATDEQLKILVEAIGRTIDTFTSKIQQLQNQIIEQKLVTDWVRKENNLKVVRKTGK